MKVSMGLTPQSMAALHRFNEFSPRLKQNLSSAIYHQLQVAQGRATAYMWEMFKAPTGELEDGWEPIDVQTASNAVSGTLSNSIPWAWRREEGFSGKTDRLGRYYAKDPGIHYMRWVLNAQKETMVAAVKQAVNDTLAGGTTRA